MILVILGISLVLLIFGGIIASSVDEDLGGFLIIPGALAFVGAFIMSIVLGVSVSKLNVIDNRIAMYQEENTRIEEQIAATVDQYQKYETEIFTEVKPESSVTLVSLYPELKSDTLVQEQIKTYTENNKTIKELKDAKITGSVKRWWLYFGK